MKKMLFKEEQIVKILRGRIAHGEMLCARQDSHGRPVEQVAVEDDELVHRVVSSADRVRAVRAMRSDSHSGFMAASSLGKCPRDLMNLLTMDWFTHQRLLELIGNVLPAAFVKAYHRQR